MPESTESEPETAPGAKPAIVDDLERRIEELDQLPEERFGRFTALDWFICAAGALLVPVALYLWYWP